MKGSNRRAKARRLVARAHQRVADARRDHLHKLSRRIVNENQVVVVEDLNVKGMVKNPNLAKAISDAGWGTLTRFIEYKCEREGKAFIKTNRWFPSTKTCSACGRVCDKMGLEVRQWTCSHCGASHDRDVNAAKNIRDEGIRLLASGTGASASRGTISRRKKLAASRVAHPDEAGSPLL
jgi:putative transposase